LFDFLYEKRGACKRPGNKGYGLPCGSIYIKTMAGRSLPCAVGYAEKTAENKKSAQRYKDTSGRSVNSETLIAIATADTYAITIQHRYANYNNKYCYI